MRIFARIVLSFIFIFYFSLTARNVHAQGEFETDYSVNYSVDQNGKTTVTQNITLKNKTDSYYADKFELKIGSIKVDEVKADDDTGQLDTDVRFDSNVTIISVKFKQKVIGVGKTLPWRLTYSSSELSTKSGQIWEISIPRLAKSAQIGSYQATVNVPRIFGPIAFMVPQAKNASLLPKNHELIFDKDQLLSSGIAISFGSKQVFTFDLKYFIENVNLTSKIETITLPPDTNYQKVVFEKIDPKPIDVDIDEEGNFVAKYKLSSKQQLSIDVKGQVEVFSKPFRKLAHLSNDQKNKYTTPQRYWETDSAFIKNKANELKTPQKIYEFVTDFLTYNQERLDDAQIERKGAAAAADAPKDAVCMEFTDLFITIARAAGIPAREVEGFAYTQNERLRPLSLALNTGDVLHAWPEYWDDKLGWVQIDPTWGSTSGGLDYFNKLDFNHISFISRGLSSTFPYPAGAYKKEENSNKKTVFVTFSEELPSSSQIPEITLKIPEKIISGIPVKIQANLKNTGSGSIIGSTLTLNSSKLKITPTNSQDLPILPPFANKTFSFNVQSPELFLRQTDTLTLSYFNVQISKPVVIVPFYLLIVSPTFLISAIVTALIVTVGLFLYRRHHKVDSTF